MILKYKYIAILAVAMLTASCSESFLDINPEQSVAAESAVVDIVTLQTALNGAYSKLQSNDYYGRTMYIIPELMADNLYLSSRNTGRYLEYETFVVSERNGEAEGLWEKGYQVIVNATRAIEGGKTLQGTTTAQQNSC
jgi:hypothetical protein